VGDGAFEPHPLTSTVALTIRQRDNMRTVEGRQITLPFLAPTAMCLQKALVAVAARG
jgi:hypothetical protein